MKYYLIAGEASGDLHASNLMKALKRCDPNADFRFWGGDRMAAVGGELVMHHRDISFMGFAEVFANIRTILGLLKMAKKDIAASRPDAVVLVDYPGFNLRIAKFAHELGIKVFYYISPQVWAWKKNRVYKIKRYVDRMFVILPFEKEFYDRFNYDVTYVGHPLLDALPQFTLKGKAEFLGDNELSDAPIIALLPGSRTQEVPKILPVMLQSAREFPEYQIVIAGMKNLGPDFYAPYVQSERVHVVFDQTYDLLNNAAVAAVASGTATLETALFDVPQVVCYETSWITYMIAKNLVNIRFISLVNLIYGKEVIRELIQGEMNSEALTGELKRLLRGDKSNLLRKQYEELRHLLGDGGASEKTAEEIWSEMSSHA